MQTVIVTWLQSTLPNNAAGKTHVSVSCQYIRRSTILLPNIQSNGIIFFPPSSLWHDTRHCCTWKRAPAVQTQRLYICVYMKLVQLLIIHTAL